MEFSQERTGLEKKFFELCDRVVKEQGLELYDLIYVSGVNELKVFIMDSKTQSAVIEDCIKVDHALTPFIDTLEWMPNKLTLEVSSPGLYRNLRDLSHFKMSLNEKILLSLSQPLDADLKAKSTLPKDWRSAKKIRAKLLDCTESSLIVAPIGGKKNDGKKGAKKEVVVEDLKLEVPLTNIKRVSLDPDYNDLLAKEVST